MRSSLVHNGDCFIAQNRTLSNKIELFSGKISIQNLKLHTIRYIDYKVNRIILFYLKFISAKYDYSLKLTLTESIRKMGLDNPIDLNIF